MTTREAFVGHVRTQVARAVPLFDAEASRRPTDPAAAAAAVWERGKAQTDALLTRFRHEAERVGAGVHQAATPAAAADLVLALGRERGVRRVATWARPRLGVAGLVAARLAQAGLEVFEGSPEPPAGSDGATLRDRLAAAEMGLTAADFAVAETGSLVLVSGPGKGRAVSLLPPYHVAVVVPEVLVPGLEEAGTLLEAWSAVPAEAAGANVVFVTGPSRTADIELTLTRGVHGPKEVHVVFVGASSPAGA